MKRIEHYQEAERLLTRAEATRANHDETNPAAALLFAEAQVHATLAAAPEGAAEEEPPSVASVRLQLGEEFACLYSDLRVAKYRFTSPERPRPTPATEGCRADLWHRHEVNVTVPRRTDPADVLAACRQAAYGTE